MPRALHPVPSPATRRDAGFTLVELLVAMIILGVLAAVALPSFLSQRRRASLATLKSDLRNAATSNEAWASAHDGRYVSQDEVAALAGEGFRPSPLVTLRVVDDNMTEHGGGFCLVAIHETLGAGAALFLASAGPTAGSPTETPCVAS